MNFARNIEWIKDTFKKNQSGEKFYNYFFFSLPAHNPITKFGNFIQRRIRETLGKKLS